MSDVEKFCMMAKMAADIERLRNENAELHDRLKIPHPDRDFVNEFNDLLASKNKEVEELRKLIAKREATIESLLLDLYSLKKVAAMISERGLPQ